jgi:hypothetical protein
MVQERLKLTKGQQELIKNMRKVISYGLIKCKDTFRWNREDEVYAYDKSGDTDKGEQKIETNGEHEAGDDIYFSYLKVYPKRT